MTSHGLRVMVVDDNEENRYILQLLLKSKGYEVVVATNGAEAVEKARLNPPDLIISDILMPVMDGFTLCRLWKKDEQLKRIPFVFYTATYTDPRDEELARNLGAERFIIKPMEPDLFLKMVDEVIHEAEKGRLIPSQKTVEDEVVYFKEYNEALIRKLEDKVLQLEEANRLLNREIAERQRIEETLRESEARYRLHFENVSDVILSLNSDLILSEISPSVEKVLGYRREELIGKPLQNLNILAPEYLEQALSDARRVLQGEQVFAALYQFITKDGSRKWGEVSCTPVVQSSLAISIISVARDVTDRKQAEEELKRSHEKLKGVLRGVVNVIISIIEERDPYTAGHQRRVTQLACAIAEEMNLQEEDIEGLKMAALIHDLGKVKIPAEILAKPGKLSYAEWSLIKLHPHVGHEILKGIEFPWPVAEIVFQHHERLNGTGYPQGLTHEQILLAARILAVADVVEAMCSHRPYRPAKGVEAAMEEISQNKGVLYDPEVVDACKKLFIEKRFSFN